MVKQAFFVSLLCLHTVAFPGDLSKDTSKGIVDQLSNHGWQFTEFKGLNDEDKNTVFEKHQENETKRILTPEIIESEYKKLPLEQQRDVFQKAHINLSTDMIESQYQTLDPDTKREIFQKANVNLSTDMIESQYQKLDPIKKREIFQKGNVQLLGDQIIAQYLSLPPEERESALKTILKTIEDLKVRVSDDVDDKNVEKSYHRMVMNIGDMLEKIKMNTAISEIMIFVNVLKKSGKINTEIWKGFIKVLAPFAPFMAEELWQEINECEKWIPANSVHLQSWPYYDEKLVIDETILIPIQINGKVRGEVQVSENDTEELVKEKVQQISRVEELLKGRNITKFLYIPRKIISIVAE